MVQMIPWAYNLERTRHPGVGLIPDFVTGMRNHGNALQAMLLYMHDTWNELTANDEVKYALTRRSRRRVNCSPPVTTQTQPSCRAI